MGASLRREPTSGSSLRWGLCIDHSKFELCGEGCHQPWPCCAGVDGSGGSRPTVVDRLERLPAVGQRWDKDHNSHTIEAVDVEPTPEQYSSRALVTRGADGIPIHLTPRSHRASHDDIQPSSQMQVKGCQLSWVSIVSLIVLVLLVRSIIVEGNSREAADSADGAAEATVFTTYTYTTTSSSSTTSSKPPSTSVLTMAPNVFSAITTTAVPVFTTLAISMRVNNLDYSLLVDHMTLLGKLEAGIKDVVSTEAGHQISSEDIIVAVGAGSVIINASIVSLVEGVARSVRSQLLVSSTLSTRMVRTMHRLGLDTISTGDLAVTDVSVVTSDVSSPTDFVLQKAGALMFGCAIGLICCCLMTLMACMLRQGKTDGYTYTAAHQDLREARVASSHEDTDVDKELATLSDTLRSPLEDQDPDNDDDDDGVAPWMSTGKSDAGEDDDEPVAPWMIGGSDGEEEVGASPKK